MEERIKELEALLIQECEKHETDCTTCPYSKECEEYAKLRNLVFLAKSRLSDYKQALGSKRSHRKRWEVATKEQED